MSLESMSAVVSTSTLVSQLYPTRNGLVSVFIQLQLNELVIISIIIIMLLFYNCRLTEAQNRMSIEHTHNTQPRAQTKVQSRLRSESRTAPTGSNMSRSPTVVNAVCVHKEVHYHKEVHN